MQIEGWKKFSINEICKSIVPGRNKPKIFDGNIPWVTTPEIKGRYLPSKLQMNYVSESAIQQAGGKIVPIGAVIMSAVGELGLVAITKEPIVINQQLHAFICSDVIYNEFLAYWLETQKNYMESVASKTTIPYMNKTNCESIPVLVPPLPEQKKIAEILSTWGRAIETVEKLVANSQQQKKALMQQLLTGQKRLLDDNGVKFGGEWEEYSLGEWLKEYNQKSSTNNEYEVLTSSRNGLVKQSDYFGENRLVQRDNTGFNVIPPNYLTYRSRSDDGSFYFNRNNFEFNGLISTYYPVFEFPNGDTNFFLNLLNQNSTLFSAYSVGTSQKVLSLNALKQVKFRLPLKKEQEKIAQVLTLADREIELYQQQLDKFKLEKKSLMQQLLTGQKRVRI